MPLIQCQAILFDLDGVLIDADAQQVGRGGRERSATRTQRDTGMVVLRWISGRK